MICVYQKDFFFTKLNAVYNGTCICITNKLVLNMEARLIDIVDYIYPNIQAATLIFLLIYQIWLRLLKFFQTMCSYASQNLLQWWFIFHEVVIESYKFFKA